jgi:hypothetical protein
MSAVLQQVGANKGKVSAVDSAGVIGVHCWRAIRPRQVGRSGLQQVRVGW